MPPTASTSKLEKQLRDLRDDLDGKHLQNQAAWAFETRITTVETTLRSIVGDNSGGSGLLHEIDKKVDTLTAEFSGTKKVLIFLGILIPIVIAAVGVVVAIYKH